MLYKITQVVRAADECFKTVGGSTRHWVRDCFLPELKEARLEIVSTDWRDQQDRLDEAKAWTEAGELAGWHAAAIRLCPCVMEDGTCGNANNFTPECHEGACPVKPSEKYRPWDRATIAANHTPLATFALDRFEDETGVSGEGRVAYGVVFPNGKAVVAWVVPDRAQSVAVYDSIHDAFAIHVGPHKGKTRLTWLNLPEYLQSWQDGFMPRDEEPAP